MYMVESAPSNSCMVRSVIAHFALWGIIRAKHNMVDSGTKQSKFCWTFWYQIRKIVFFALGRHWSMVRSHVLICWPIWAMTHWPIVCYGWNVFDSQCTYNIHSVMCLTDTDSGKTGRNNKIINIYGPGSKTRKLCQMTLNSRPSGISSVYRYIDAETGRRRTVAWFRWLERFKFSEGLGRAWNRPKFGFSAKDNNLNCFGKFHFFGRIWLLAKNPFRPID